MKGLTRLIALVIYLLVVVCSNALAQSWEGSGTVTASHDNTTVPGVNILIKGPTNGITTGADGKFGLRVKDNSTVLEISSIGYAIQEIVVGTQSLINGVLSSEITTLSSSDIVRNNVRRGWCY